MGADITLVNQREIGGEPVADILIKSSALKGIEIGGATIPRLIDELPLLALAAAQAEGVTAIRDAAELRVKETNRIDTTAEELTKLGGKIETQPDGFIIEGPTSLQGNLSQSRRQQAMNAFRKGHVKVLVATDIAARGIDVKKVSHVINYDIPDTAVAYTHRTGRTGRMEKLGTALTLVTQEDRKMVRSIERLMGTSFEKRKVDGFKPTPKTNRSNPAYHQRSGNASRN